MKKLLAGLALVLALAGCSSTPAPAESPAPTTAEVEAKDVTVDVKKAAGNMSSLIVSAEETEPGRIEVQTTIVDPRGEDGSRPALDAVRLCNKVVEMGGLTNVDILEKDRTTFAVYGVSIVNDGKCGEY